jgi:hypothetical protein
MTETNEEKKPRYATLEAPVIEEQKPKASTTKTTTSKKKTKSVKKEKVSKPAVTEVIKEVEVPYSPKRYEVEIYKKASPVDRLAGRFGYWESTDELKLLEYKDSFGADVEGLLLGNIRVDGVGISVHNDKKNWIKNLCNAELGFKFYASTARELNETE